MFRTKERERLEPAMAAPVMVKRVFAPPTWNPPLADFVTIPFTIPAHRASFEKFRYEDWSGFHHPDGRYKRRWKSCQHYKCYLDPNGTVSNIPWSCLSATSLGMYSSAKGTAVPEVGPASNGVDARVLTDHPTFRSQFGAYGSHIEGIPSLLSVEPDGGFVPAPAALGDLTRVALMAMVPAAKAELSLVNSIYELKDFKSLPHTIARLQSLASGASTALSKSRAYVRKLTPAWKRLYRSFDSSTPTLRELRHGAADGYLQYQFNIAPLLSDIAGISDALFKLQSTLRKTVLDAGRIRRKHFTRFWQEFEGAALYTKDIGPLRYNLGQFAGYSTPPGYTGVYNEAGLQFMFHRRTTHYEPTEFHAELEYSTYYTKYQTENARLLTLLDSLGVNLNPQIIWNAIPWSFVIDWVISVGSWLGRQKSINMEPQLSVHRYLWSWTRHQRTAVYFNTTGTPGTGNYYQPAVGDTYLPTFYESTYRRDITLPASTNSLFGSGLSAVELSLGVALSNTAGRHPRTRMRL